MSRRTRKGRRSELGISTYLTRRSSALTQGSEPSNSSVLKIEKSGNAESVVTMKTRVAVRDQTPHRFQIIPLREVKDSVDTQPERYTAPSTTGNRSLLSPSGYVGLHSHERSPIDTPRKENSRRQNVDTTQNSFLTPKNPLATKSKLAPPYIVSKKVLTEMDLNRDPTTSTEALSPLGPLSMASSSCNGPHLAAPHTLNNEFRTDGKHRTLATFGSTNVSEISQLFCSDNSESQPVRRRNRSLTVTTIRSDTSAAMSDTVDAEAKLKRRHAIYRESHMSYLDTSNNRRRNDTASESDRESWSSSLSHRAFYSPFPRIARSASHYAYRLWGKDNV